MHGDYGEMPFEQSEQNRGIARELKSVRLSSVQLMINIMQKIQTLQLRTSIILQCITKLLSHISHADCMYQYIQASEQQKRLRTHSINCGTHRKSSHLTLIKMGGPRRAVRW